MKKNKLFLSLMTAFLIFAFFVGNLSASEQSPVEVPAPQKNTFVDRLILYVPNRTLDLLDIVDVSIGLGPKAKVKAWITRYCDLGLGFGSSAKLVKGYNRQYGAGLESGMDASLFMYSVNDVKMYDTTRDVQEYFLYDTGIPSINNTVYNFWKGPRDIFSIGLEGAAFLDVGVEVHPFEIIDFFAGFFFLDPKGDDLTMDSFRK